MLVIHKLFVIQSSVLREAAFFYVSDSPIVSVMALVASPPLLHNDNNNAMLPDQIRIKGGNEEVACMRVYFRVQVGHARGC